ncbi:MAG: alkylation response protein AidB-like acyl-CoA dehydrogenase, partial [Bacteroidia bacterium]
MDFKLSEEQEMLVASVRRFVDEEILPHEQLVEDTDEVP